MATDYYEPLVSEPEIRLDLVKFVGGTNAVTKVYGKGITVTYVSAGLVDITWSANGGNPGTFIGPVGMPCFQATTAADVAGHTCVIGAYNATTRTVRVAITNAADTLHNLAALEWLTLVFAFKAGSV